VDQRCVGRAAPLGDCADGGRHESLADCLQHLPRAWSIMAFMILMPPHFDSPHDAAPSHGKSRDTSTTRQPPANAAGTESHTCRSTATTCGTGNQPSPSRKPQRSSRSGRFSAARRAIGRTRRACQSTWAVRPNPFCPAVQEGLRGQSTCRVRLGHDQVRRGWGCATAVSAATPRSVQQRGARLDRGGPRNDRIRPPSHGGAC
jgi:hypothetical protein